ncbi:MAG TPA: cysteine dioxygenase family protein [Jatrophihabitantaceae bacterium]
MTAVVAAAADLGPATPLNPIELVEFTRFVANEVRRGRYPFVRFDDQARWHQRIYRDRRVDAWLISWLPDQGTQLHDHGGSSGAFTVLSGQLSEAVCAHTGRYAGGLHECVHRAGHSVGFDGDYVHDVRNLSTAPAVSVHAYSPALTSMTYYDRERGQLIELATVLTNDPEPTAGPWP